MTESTPASPATMTQAEFARHLGVSQVMVSKHKHNERLVIDDSGRVKVAESIARLTATADPSKAKKTQPAPTNQAVAAELPPSPPTDEPSYQDARKKREHFAAETAELEYRKAAGELMVAADVVSTIANAITSLRNRLETLPDTLAPILAAMTSEQAIRTELAEQIENALSDLSHAMRMKGTPG